MIANGRPPNTLASGILSPTTNNIPTRSASDDIPRLTAGKLLKHSTPNVVAYAVSPHIAIALALIIHRTTPMTAHTRFARTLLLAFLALVILPRIANAAGRPNIIFFLADDQRNDTLGCAGHPIVKTPNIDRLAANGTRFTNAFVQHSICWVSRTTLLTGLTARSFGSPTKPDAARADALNEMCPDELRRAGYRTGFFGKWHAKMPKGFKPEDHFDNYEAIFRRPYHKPQPDGSTRHESQLIGDRAISFLDEHDKAKPFYLSLWFNAGHAEDGDKRPGHGHFPWPKVVDGMYDDITVPPPRLNAVAIYDQQPQFLKDSINRERFFWRWDTAEKYQINMRAYFRMLSGIDHVVGRVMSKLDSLGLHDNTIIVYSGDNGYYMGDRGFAGKWSHYEQSLRVPMIIRDPRVDSTAKKQVIDSMALNLDLPATFLDWAGTKIPESYQGRSLKMFVNGSHQLKNIDWRSDFFCEHVTLAPHITWEGVRNERYVYARYFDQKPVCEFVHDLQTDPDQLKNLANSPGHKQVVEELRARCDALVTKYGGPLAPIEQRSKRRKKAKPKAKPKAKTKA
ncbi:sulfatase [bacterium]|nr:sulfatase [bacterium]